ALHHRVVELRPCPRRTNRTVNPGIEENLRNGNERANVQSGWDRPQPAVKIPNCQDGVIDLTRVDAHIREISKHPSVRVFSDVTFFLHHHVRGVTTGSLGSELVPVPAPVGVVGYYRDVWVLLLE